MNPERILIVRRDNIGDLVCTTPMLHALRERFPDARIDALVNSYNAPVLAANPDVDHVFAYTKVKHRAAEETALGVLWARMKLLWCLRRVGYDLAILANDGDTARALGLVRWLAPKRVLRFARSGETVSDWVRPKPVAPCHAVEIANSLLTALQMPAREWAAVVRATPQSAEQASKQLHASLVEGYGRPIAIHISARKPSQRWPVEHFAALMQALNREQNACFMLFWSPGAEDNPLHPGDDGKAKALLQAVGNLPVVPYPTARLEELIGGLAQCRAMICSDGGAMHLGAGLGLPIVCFFGQSDSTRWHPWGVPYELLQPPSQNVADIDVGMALAAWRRLGAPLA